MLSQPHTQDRGTYTMEDEEGYWEGTLQENSFAAFMLEPGLCYWYHGYYIHAGTCSRMHSDQSVACYGRRTLLLPSCWSQVCVTGTMDIICWYL